MSEEAPLGAYGQAHIIVTSAVTAAAVGSGDLPVFATPALAALMEAAAVDALAAHLPPEKTSVGVRIDVRHLAATPVGLTVFADAKLTAISGRHLTFEIVASDEKERVGEALHERIIVDRSRFMQRVAGKGG